MTTPLRVLKESSIVAGGGIGPLMTWTGMTLVLSVGWGRGDSVCASALLINRIESAQLKTALRDNMDVSCGGFVPHSRVRTEHSRTLLNIREHSRAREAGWNWVCFRSVSISRLVETKLAAADRAFSCIFVHEGLIVRAGWA